VSVGDLWRFLAFTEILLYSCVRFRLGLPRVLEYLSTTRIVKYSSNFFTLLEYLLVSISGCKFPFPVAVS